VGHLGCEIEIEPGRLISGNAGVLCQRVIYVKERRGARLPDPRRRDERPVRPSMYGAHHDIVPVVEPRRARPRRAVRRGRPGLRDRRYLCQGAPLPLLAEGDLVAFRSAGPMAR
jgi:diaminopimelate decarboxylase